jgi:hypothetical protein
MAKAPVNHCLVAGENRSSTSELTGTMMDPSTDNSGFAQVSGQFAQSHGP